LIFLAPFLFLFHSFALILPHFAETGELTLSDGHRSIRPILDLNQLSQFESHMTEEINHQQ
jgi:hypothetical protein